MSILKVANVHLETTGTNRIDYNSNGFTRIISGGTGGIVINTGGTDKINVGTNIAITGNLLLNGKNVDTLISSTSPAFDKANSANIVAVSAFDKANSTLANTSGTFAGDLTTTGTVNARSGIISTANNTVGSVGQALLSTGSGTFWGTLASESLLNIQSFTSGTTYTKTSGTNKIFAIGTGGGSGTVPASGCDPAFAGGAGGTFIRYLDVSANSTLSYTIGAGGSVSGAGGSTTLGTNAMFGNARGASSVGVGGTSSNGTVNITGGSRGASVKDPGSSFFGSGASGGGAYGSGGHSDSNSGTAGILIIFEFA